MRELIIGCAQIGRAGVFTVLHGVNHSLGVLNAKANGKGLFLKRYYTYIYYLKRVARAMANA